MEAPSLVLVPGAMWPRHTPAIMIATFTPSERKSSSHIFLVVLRTESPSAKCAKLHIVAACDNRDHAPRSFFAYANSGSLHIQPFTINIPRDYRPRSLCIILRALPACGELHIESNAGGRLATVAHLITSCWASQRRRFSTNLWTTTRWIWLQHTCVIARINRNFHRTLSWKVSTGMSSLEIAGHSCGSGRSTVATSWLALRWMRGSPRT